MLTKYTEVEYEITFNDVMDYLEQASASELEQIANAVGAGQDFITISVQDEVKLEFLRKHFKELTIEQLESLIKNK